MEYKRPKWYPMSGRNRKPGYQAGAYARPSIGTSGTLRTTQRQVKGGTRRPYNP